MNDNTQQPQVSVQESANKDEKNIVVYGYDHFDRILASSSASSNTVGNPDEEPMGEEVAFSSVRRIPPPTESPSSSTIVEVQVHDNNDESSSTRHRLMHVAVVVGISRAGAPDNLIGPVLDQTKAMLMAQHHFNNRWNKVVPNLGEMISTKCPDLRVSLEFYDSELNPRVAVQRLTQAIDTRPAPYQATALVGSLRSAVSIPLAVLNARRFLPQVSYLSTSTTLDDRGSFPSFGRVIPSNRGDARVALDFFQTVAHTTHLGILYIDDEYGAAFRLELERLATKAGVVTQSRGVAWDNTLTDDSRTRLLTAVRALVNTGYKHFMGILFQPQLEFLVEIGVAEQIMGPGKLWVFGDGVSVGAIDNFQFPAGSPQARALHGNAVLTLGTSNADGSYQRFVQAFQEQDQTEGFLDYWVSKSPRASETDVRFPTNFTSSNPGVFSELAYDAVMSVALAGCRSNQTYFTGRELFPEFLQSDFVGGSGRVRVDTKTAARVATSVNYVLRNIRVAPDPEVAAMVGADLVVALEFVRPDNAPPQWQSPQPGVIEYVFSDNTTLPPAPLPPLEIADILAPATVSIWVSLAGIVIVSAVAFSIWTILQRSSHVVRASQPSFLLVIAIGECFMMIALILNSLASPPYSEEWARLSCMPAIWVFSLGFSLVFSALFAKIRRINKLLGGGRSFRRVTVTLADASLPGCALVLGSLLVLAAWQATDPLRYELEFDEFASLDEYGRPFNVLSTCQTDKGLGKYFASVLISIMLITLAAANFQAYKARRITSEFSESVYIGWSMAICLQGLLLAIPIFVFDSNPSTSFIARSALVLLLAASTLFLIFVPKIYHHRAHVKERKEKKEARHNRLKRAAESATQGPTEIFNDHYRSTASARSIKTADSSELGVKFVECATPPPEETEEDRPVEEGLEEGQLKAEPNQAAAVEGGQLAPSEANEPQSGKERYDEQSQVEMSEQIAPVAVALNDSFNPHVEESEATIICEKNERMFDATEALKD